MPAYYNEFDPKAAAWLRELINDGLIAPGEVDERSILEVSTNDLKGFHQHHFFAGVGGWSYALRLAQWTDDSPVWTASLPCQPFSTAGKGLGKNDERHLLPHFLELVKKCRPDVLFGEQVERAIGHGWLDDLQATMEAEGYAIGHCVLGAHSVSAAHIRQRLYWVADSSSSKRKRQQNERSAGLFGATIQSEECISRPCDMGAASSRLHDAQSQRRYIHHPEDDRPPNGKGYSLANSSNRSDEQSSVMRTTEIDWIYCRDNKYRPIESGVKPLVDGVSRGMVHSSDPRNTQEARAMRLKGYGNAIVPQLAAEFIKAWKLSTTQNVTRTTGF